MGVKEVIGKGSEGGRGEKGVKGREEGEEEGGLDVWWFLKGGTF